MNGMSDGMARERKGRDMERIKKGRKEIGK
jgi:hypothetical protein